MRSIWLYVVGVICLWTATESRAESAPVVSRATGFTVAQAQQIVGTKSRQVVGALQKNDTAMLARFVHPAGVRFAPYAHVTNHDLIFRRSAVASLRDSPRVRNWGIADGSGYPIRSTWNSFRSRYLVAKGRDFLSAPEINYNTFRARGNTLNNLRVAYPGAIFVEYYLPGTAKYSGMDWRSLWLVWRPVGKTWYLRAIVGDRWTT